MNIFLILIILLFILCFYNNTVEGFNDRDLFDKLMNDFQIMFPDRNRNAGGPQYYYHIVENIKPTIEEFKKYNQYFCPVSGSPIDPKRTDAYNHVVMEGLDNQKYYGKFYRCCWPCVCDIIRENMVYIVEHTIKLKDGDYTHHVLTINDPCLFSENIPKGITSFNCDTHTLNGLHTENGRLIIGILHDVEIYDKNKHDINDINEMCNERNNTPIDKLKGGMGDLSSKLYSLWF